MSKSQSKQKLGDRILACLEEGEKDISEIQEAVGASKNSVSVCLTGLVKSGKVVRVRSGVYRLASAADATVVPADTTLVPADTTVEVENSRSETENIETINKLLKSYDIVLDNIAETLESELSAKATIEGKINLIKSLRWLGATVDQLMKRWYLVHRGYDSNTRQAQEDAKKKTVDREKQALENTPPEERVVVVREYNESMRDILENLPEPIQKKHKV